MASKKKLKKLKKKRAPVSSSHPTPAARDALVEKTILDDVARVVEQIAPFFEANSGALSEKERMIVRRLQFLTTELEVVSNLIRGLSEKIDEVTGQYVPDIEADDAIQFDDECDDEEWAAWVKEQDKERA